MVHSALDVEGPVEKWVVPVWSLQAPLGLDVSLTLGEVDIMLCLWITC